MSIDYAEAARLIRKGRKSEQRGKALQGCITGLITFALLSLLKGWLFMLFLDVAHAHWWPAIPTIGYWWSVLLMVLLPSLGSSSSTKRED
ncbi:hypothetical protein Drose_04455 [Dactylosporangium roseum]|uniref:Uncharacterized protein n=1 Tax=Dactylosporangium roseum TaxID=47989 RepID=A0ABY5Z694_9ACTN|nr:hypothetical protein [Dactylosporangium roseum]UWZ37541.1 hypothetical protein Drose_04455 [Dactylosporangium roseum]